jgi:GT2 family glycosyltransferase
MNPLFSVVIVNWNTSELLLNCVQSIFEHTDEKNYDIWVVDNASTDNSVEALRAKYPEVKLIASQKNLGFAGGNNLALEKISGKYALLLNTDTLVKPNAFDHLLSFMENNPGVGAVGPYLLNPDGSMQISCYPFPTLFREFWRMFHFDLAYPIGTYQMSAWDLQCNRQVDSIQGACMLVRKAALDQIGFFDSSYFMYTEEIDLCYRLHQAGWSLFWIPEAKVVHFGGQSTRKVASKMFLSLYQTKVQFFRKHHGNIAAVLYKIILFFASLIRIVLSPLVLLQKGFLRERNRYLSMRYFELIAALWNM